MNCYNIKKGLDAVFTKVSENGSKTGIRIIFVNQGKIFDTIKADKVDLLGKATKLKKSLLSLDIDFNNKEIEKVIDIAIRTLKRDKALNDSEKVDIKTTLRTLLKKARNVCSEDTLYEDGEYMYINTLHLSKVLKESGWKPLDFKRQLRDMGLLITSQGRPFDFKKNSSKAKGTVAIWFLKIRLKNHFTELININMEAEGEEVA